MKRSFVNNILCIYQDKKYFQTTANGALFNAHKGGIHINTVIVQNDI